MIKLKYSQNQSQNDQPLLSNQGGIHK